MISDAGLRESSAKPIKPHSVLMAMYGANVGQLGWLKVPATVNQAICAMETDPDHTNGRWLLYSLMHWRPALIAKAHGAAQQNLSQALIREFEVPTPPLTVQRKIAAVLAAYDELIENNLRRIQVLEEMAQAVYREWFVNFRYPGHETVPLVDSPIGPIPRGWEVVALGELATFRSGGSTTKRSFVNEGFLAYSASGPDGRLPDYDIDGEGVVISAVGANCGRTWLASGKWSNIANTIRFVPNGEAPAAYLFLATSGNPWPKRGAAQPFVSINDCRAHPIRLPPEGVLRSFEDLVGPFYKLSRSLTHQNANLRSTRDLLLPKLVSGEIDVSNLDIDTGWLVA